MKAIAIQKSGLPNEAFQTMELPIMEIREEEVLIQVKATSINLID